MKKKSRNPPPKFWRCPTSGDYSRIHPLTYSYRSLKISWCPICSSHVHLFENEKAMAWSKAGIIHIDDSVGEAK